MTSIGIFLSLWLVCKGEKMGLEVRSAVVRKPEMCDRQEKGWARPPSPHGVSSSVQGIII